MAPPSGDDEELVEELQKKYDALRDKLLLEVRSCNANCKVSLCPVMNVLFMNMIIRKKSTSSLCHQTDIIML